MSNSAKFLYFLVKQQMKEQENMQDSFEVFRQNLQNFIDISLMEDETSWMDWIANVSRKIDVKCWEEKKPVTKKGRQKRGVHGN